MKTKAIRTVPKTFVFRIADDYDRLAMDAEN
jgi:hypothetical protein